RYPIFEGEATNRVIRLAEGAGVPVYIVHLSARDALEGVRAARDRGSMTFAETCPQYLFLSIDDMGNGFEGAKFVCSPPLRPADHQDELWRGRARVSRSASGRAARSSFATASSQGGVATDGSSSGRLRITLGWPDQAPRQRRAGEVASEGRSAHTKTGPRLSHGPVVPPVVR